MDDKNRPSGLDQSVLDAFCREYDFLFMLRQSDCRMEVIHVPKEFAEAAKKIRTYDEVKEQYCERCICENDRGRVKYYAGLDHVSKKLKQQKMYELIYQTNDYEWMAARFYKVKETQDTGALFLLGLIKYNQDMQEAQRVRRVNEIITSFSESFQAIYRVNVLTADLEILLLKFAEQEFVYQARDTRELEKNYRRRFIDPAFLKSVEKEASMDAVREHFLVNEDPIVTFYQEKSGRWMKLVVVKDIDYTPEHPFVIYAIKENNRQVRERTKSAVNQMAMAKMFLLAVTIDLPNRTYRCYHGQSPYYEAHPEGSLDEMLAYLKQYIYEEDFGIFCSLIFQSGNEKDRFTEREFRAEDENGMFHMICGYVTTVLLPEGERLLLLIQNIDERAVNNARINSLNRQIVKANSMIYALSDSYCTVYSVDMETGTVMASRYLDDITDEIKKGRNINFIMDMYIRRYVHPKDRERMRHFIKRERILREMNEVGKRDYFEFCRDFGKEYRWMRMEILTTRCEDGQIREMVFAFQDIHDERVVQLRQQEELKQALRAAEAANTAKTTFLTNISHDIRTPMNAILGLTELTIKHMEQKELVKENLDKIAQAGKNLLGLINEVLDMSYIESGKLILRNTEFSLTELVQGIEQMFGGQIQDKRIRYDSDLTQIRNRIVSADKVRLTQIVTNLLSNAIKYTPEGGTVRLTVRQLPTSTGTTGRYEMTIRDTGIGMSEDLIQRVFLPFERGGNAVSSRAEGVGLGLSITKELVELMGGTITVDSRFGSGSAFTVTLPFKMVSQKKVSAADSSFTGQNFASGQDVTQVAENVLKGKKILVVDDNEINLEIACDFLRDMQAEVFCAGNGKEAVRMIKENRTYDAVLMDVRMPVMDGYEATKRIRKMHTAYTDRLPIIAMTANAFAEDVELSKLSGMTEHISKPVDAQKLYRILARAMSHISET